MTKLFISYSRKDTDFVRKLAGDLEKAGYDVWWDLSDLRGGDDWVNTIPAAIAASQYVLVVLTPDSTESQWVRKEYTQALSLRKKIIPILLRPGNVPFALNTINFINFTSGEYEDRFKELLSALDFTGQPPEVTPYRKALLSLPPALLKFGIPIGIGLILLLAVLARAAFPPAPPPDPTVSSTPTTSTPVPVVTDTPTVSPTATSGPTSTATPSRTEPAGTDTPTRTPTLTPTLPPAFALPLCISGDSNVNVREGPGSNYEILGTLKGDGTKCPFFSAYTRNRGQELWFQLAPSTKAEFQPFGGGWIYASSLAAADLGLLPSPICIFASVDVVEVRIGPDENRARQGDPLEADGTNCPFFDTRSLEIVNGQEETWYHVAPDQKAKEEEFGQYAGGWLREDFLVHVLQLPAVTLTPTPLPSDTLTITPTFTRTPTSTLTPSETPSETPSPTEAQSTETPTETPTP